jgi:uncharacterized membrane protein
MRGVPQPKVLSEAKVTPGVLVVLSARGAEPAAVRLPTTPWGVTGFLVALPAATRVLTGLLVNDGDRCAVDPSLVGGLLAERQPPRP